jgi:hypothetical protein
MSALTDGAIRQVKQTGLEEEAGFNSTATRAAGPLRPQKCDAWMVVDNRTQAKHTIATQLNHFVDRALTLNVFDTALDLDAPGHQPSVSEGQ